VGSVRQALIWFVEEGLQLQARSSWGEQSWGRPVYPMLQQMLTNPTYGGAYGHSEHKPSYEDGYARTKARRRKGLGCLALDFSCINTAQLLYLRAV